MVQHDEQQHETATPARDGVDKDVPLSWELRVLLLAVLGLVPGVQLGCFAALLFSASGALFNLALLLGGVLGMIGFGLLEADYWA